MILAFHNEPSIKAAVMTRLREHRRLDQIAQGFYYESKENRGCHLGCLTHHDSNAHEAAERLFGIEQRIGYWLEAVFEGLPKECCADWVIASTEAIPNGADLSKCHHHFGAWLLGESGLATITDVNREAIEWVRKLHEQAAIGTTISEEQWSAAQSAAQSAARSAWSAAWYAAESARYAALSARYAAESDAESARYAAESAQYAAESDAESARYAAWSARYAAESDALSDAESDALSDAESDARYAAWKKIAAKSIEIFAAAPVPQSVSTITPEVERDLCCRNLWCRDVEVACGK